MSRRLTVFNGRMSPYLGDVKTRAIVAQFESSADQSRWNASACRKSKCEGDCIDLVIPTAWSCVGGGEGEGIEKAAPGYVVRAFEY